MNVSKKSIKLLSENIRQRKRREIMIWCNQISGVKHTQKKNKENKENLKMFSIDILLGH